MSLEDFKNNLEKIKDISFDFSKLSNEKEKVELDIKNLKSKYRENKIEREVFSEYNKKLAELNNELEKIKQKVEIICRKNNDIINDELKDV